MTKGEKNMENLRVLLCCGAGMSSGFLASGARKTIKKQKLPMTIEARSITEAGEFMSSIDVMLLGPHYAKDLEKFQEIAKPYGVQVGVIPDKIYGSLDANGLIEFAKEIAKGE